MLQVINTEIRKGRTITNHTGNFEDFMKLADDYKLILEKPLSNGTIYACDENTDLAFRPQKGNSIRLTVWVK